ncbi:hypothetical protein [Streptomyces sp. 2A115]|uniref:hypothetical protein n=1 Tax=Streptomyces sp. 2A115 TaxID=3457439 RepID=UPI003FD64D50
MLGLARELAAVLATTHQTQREARYAAKAAADRGHAAPGFLARLLSSHPGHPTRPHRLRPYL